MKNIIFIIRDGFDAEYICNNITHLKESYNIYFVYETGKIARKKKIKRMIKSSANIFQALINMFFLVLFDKIMLKNMNKQCGNRNHPSTVQSYYVDDVNEQVCIDICNKLNPDLIMIYGTGILTRGTIEKLKADIYNIHSSILPYYRNVHSDFWAYMNEEYDKIGITIFKLNTGIDTGGIAKQVVCDLPNNAKLYDYKAGNLKNIVKTIPVFIEEYFNGQITLQQQDEESGSISYTPGTTDIIKLLKKEKSNN